MGDEQVTSIFILLPMQSSYFHLSERSMADVREQCIGYLATLHAMILYMIPPRQRATT